VLGLDNLLALLVPWAYAGPGAGLKLVDDFVNLLIGVGIALTAILLWPLFAVLRRLGPAFVGAGVGAIVLALAGLLVSQYWPLWGGGRAKPWTEARHALIPAHVLGFGLAGIILGGILGARKKQHRQQEPRIEPKQAPLAASLPESPAAVQPDDMFREVRGIQ
jgi:hypothetical protein